MSGPRYGSVSTVHVWLELFAYVSTPLHCSPTELPLQQETTFLFKEVVHMGRDVTIEVHA